MGDWSVVSEPAKPASGSDWSVVQPASAAPAPAPSNTAQTSGAAATNAAIYHGIANGGTFGAGAAVSAAIDTTLHKILPKYVLGKLQQFNEVGGSAGLPLDQEATYDQRRAAYQQAFGQSQQQHPVATAGGELFGGLAAGGSGVAAADTVAAKLGGGAAARLAGAAAGGAVTGAEFGAGGAASQGLDPVSGLKQAGKGAAAGLASGVALHGLTELGAAATNKASKALEDKYVKTFGNEVAGGATKKGTAKAWSTAINRAEEDGVSANAAKNYVKSAELAPVEAAARHGKFQQAIEEVDKNLARYSPGRLANYQAVDEARPFPVGEGLDSLDKAIFKAKNQVKDHQAVTALEKARAEWVNDYSSADAGAVQRALLRPEGLPGTEVADELRSVVDKLPQSGPVTRTDFAKATSDVSPEALRYIDQHILDPKQGILSWNPQAHIPSVELRAEASRRQQSALQAFDALNPQFSEHTKGAVKKAINQALEQHLDKAAAAGQADTVRRIRNDDVKFSVLLAARRGLQEQAEKQARKESQIKTILRHVANVGALPSAAYAAGEGQEAVNDVSEGKYLQAGKHGAEALFFGGLAGAGAFRGASILHNRLTNPSINLPSSPGASAFIQSLQQRLPGAVAGTVATTTLGQVQQ